MDFKSALHSHPQAKQRVRFFQLVDVFLASGMVPAYTAAAFAKRFARLALRAPPAGEKLGLCMLPLPLYTQELLHVLCTLPPPPSSSSQPAWSCTRCTLVDSSRSVLCG